MKISFLVFVLIVLVHSSACAQEVPKLSGIMQGDSPTAILNDQILAVGDETNGFRVVEIGYDYVVCEGKKGLVRLSMAQEDSAKEKPKTKKSQAAVPARAPAAAAAQGMNPQMQQKAAQFLEKSIDRLKEADKLLRSPFVFERLYDKAIELCDAADREAQSAMRSVTGDTPKAGIANHIEKIRKAKTAIVKEKAEFSTRMRSLIASRQVATGMTQRDVTSSWGQPLMQNRDGTLLKWVYQDANGYQKELVFKDGILVSF